jgi:hypothetical protein
MFVNANVRRKAAQERKISVPVCYLLGSTKGTLAEKAGK